MQKQPSRCFTEEQEKKNKERIDRVNEMLGRCSVWFAVIVPPQKERLIEQILGALGFDAFVPIQFRWRRVNSRQKVKKYVPYVMASRYVFVGFETLPVPWHRLLGLRLISGVIGHEGQPIAIPPVTMRSLFATSGEEEARTSAVRLNRSIVAGDTVLITDGPFRGHQVRIEGIERNKASVLIEMFQTAQRIEISLDALEAL